MNKIYEYIRGYYTVSASARGASTALDVLVKNCVPFYRVRAEGEGRVSFRLDSAGLKRYLSLTDGHIIEDEKVERTGLFSVAQKYKLRIGYFTGAVIFALLLFSSSLFVWDINIEGETSVSENEILSALEKQGLYTGAFIPRINTEVISLETVINIKELSYTSINLRGTVAQVIVREEKENEKEKLSVPSNLVALRDGQIETIELLGGMPSVKHGQIVKKGQLLVSGVIDSQAVGYRLVRSRGNVFARVTLSYDASVPLDFEQKTYTGKQIIRKSVKFFAKKINLFSNGEISYEKYDTIEVEKRFCLFGIVELPIFIKTLTISEYTLTPAQRTEGEAIKLAYRDILAQSEGDLSGAQVLARYQDVTVSDGVLHMHCDIECIADIAKEVIIETD